MPVIGRPAPSFSLPDQHGVLRTLADQRGRWVVLYFYPKDDTPGCTVEACEFTASLADFRGLDAEVFGCSADSAASHAKFIAKHRLGITLLTDADRKVMKAYGAYGKKTMYGRQVEGVIRSTVLIAPDGKVAHHWATVRAAGHAQEVRTKLAELSGAPAAVPVERAVRKAPKKIARATKQAAKKPATRKAPAGNRKPARRSR